MTKTFFRRGRARKVRSEPSYGYLKRALLRDGGLSDTDRLIVLSVEYSGNSTREPLLSRDAVAGLAGISASHFRARQRYFDAICGYAKRTAHYLGESASRFYTFRTFRGQPGCWGRNIWMGRRLVRALARALLPTQSIGIQLQESTPTFPPLTRAEWASRYRNLLFGAASQARMFGPILVGRVEVACA